MSTQKEYMDALTSLVAPPKIEVTDAEDLRGRPTLLKSYLIETNSPLVPTYQFDHTTAEIADTGLDTIKILTMRTQLENARSVGAQFYLDTSDKRFLVLHTNYRAEETHPFIEKLIASTQQAFDNAWLSTNTLKKLGEGVGNIDYGFQVNYADIFDKSDDADDITPQEDFRLDTTGTISARALALLKQDVLVERTIGYERVTVGRGTRSRGVLDEVTYNGRFSVLKGKSVNDHIILVDTIKSEYMRQVKEIEERRIYGNPSTQTIEGTAFDLEFNRDVVDWNRYIGIMFNAKSPFRLWGIKSKVDERMYRVLAVDMHTGHPVDIEITDHLMRVYLPHGSCGNVVLRMFVNLQRYFDSRIRCSFLS